MEGSAWTTSSPWGTCAGWGRRAWRSSPGRSSFPRRRRGGSFPAWKGWGFCARREGGTTWPGGTFWRSGPSPSWRRPGAARRWSGSSGFPAKGPWSFSAASSGRAGWRGWAGGRPPATGGGDAPSGPLPAGDPPKRRERGPHRGRPGMAPPPHPSPGLPPLQPQAQAGGPGLLAPRGPQAPRLLCGVPGGPAPGARVFAFSARGKPPSTRPASGRGTTSSSAPKAGGFPRRSSPASPP